MPKGAASSPGPGVLKTGGAAHAGAAAPRSGPLISGFTTPGAGGAGGGPPRGPPPPPRCGSGASAKTPRAWTFKPTSAVNSATNPEYQGTGYIDEYEPLSGSFGEVLGTRFSIVPSVAGVTRAVS